MASIRIGIASEFNLVDSKVGVGTTNPTELMDVRGQIYSDNSIGAGGISTVTTYQGFLDTKQTIKSSVSEGTVVAGSLSEEIVIEGEVTVSSGTTYRSGVDHLTVTDNFTLPGISDDKPSAGTMRFNENLGALEFYTGVEWRAVNSYVDMSNRSRVVFGGASNDSDLIQYFNTATQGNSNNFGNLTSAKSELNGMSDGTRGLFANGYSSPGGRLNIIEYITIASEGNGIDFGDSTMRRNSGDSGCSSSTRGVMAGGYTHGNSPANPQNVIDYVEIQTIGNALDFGDLAYEYWGLAACSSPTRGLWGGGGTSGSTPHEEITMITIASKGNSVDFGVLTQARYYGGASGNSVRGIWAGGYIGPSTAGQKTIDYVTIASTGNAIDFGERTVGHSYGCATATQTRSFMIGGRDVDNATNGYNIIDYVNIASTGNALDFGDILWNTRYFAIGALSDSHGGLGGF